MKLTLTQEQADLIRKYLEYYYKEHKNGTIDGYSKDVLPFKTQMELLYDAVSYLVK